jgi:hypothetical protein
MQLSAPFFKLPLRFDATRLAAEVAQFTEAEWRPHPQGHPGNSALPYIARHGNPLDDGVAGPMRPTPHLARCPYLMQAMGALDVTLGRSRLMRLDARAEATPHVDLSYYWQQRVRVHIPVITFPDVTFLCGDASTHMAAGDCWIFDTWRVHNVLNPANAQRIHLVIDTVGSASFWQRVEAGGAAVDVPYQPGAAPSLRFESNNYPIVMAPAEMASLWSRWVADARAGGTAAASLAPLEAAVEAVFGDWRAAWAEFGDRAEGFAHFAALRDRIAALGDAHAGRIVLPNRMDLAALLKVSLAPALMSPELAAAASTARAAPVAMPATATQVPELGQAAQPVAARPGLRTVTPPAPPSAVTAAGADDAAATAATSPLSIMPKLTVQWGLPNFVRKEASPPQARLTRPLIIVAAPRSGSTLLFETLADAPGLYTVGGESHDQLESIAALRPSINGPQSNRADATAATPAVVAELHERFRKALRDRDGRAPGDGAPRLLEKTPKNALRVPFLDAAFPDARFVYLYRDFDENVASMMDGWESGRFVMYANLPGWKGLPWSFLLVPGWQDLIGADVATIAATQWLRTQSVLLDDLDKLPRERVHALTYREFLASPTDCVRAICRFAALDWDRALPATLPLSRHTLTPPAPEKWRRREAAIAPHRAALARVGERAKAFVARAQAGATPATATSGG